MEVAEDLQMPQFDMYAYNTEGCVHKYKTGGCLGPQGFKLVGTTFNLVMLVVLYPYFLPKDFSSCQKKKFQCQNVRNISLLLKSLCKVTSTIFPSGDIESSTVYKSVPLIYLSINIPLKNEGT